MLKQLLLVKQAKKGNHEAFITLIQNYEIVLYNMAYRFLGNEDDVADALQETIMIAFQKIEQLNNPRYFNTWICKILINNCQKIIKNRQFFVELENVPIQDDVIGTEDLYFQDWLNGLDDLYSTPLILRYYHGFSIKEISEILDEPAGTIKSKLSRGKKKLKEIEIKGEVSL